MKRSPESKEKRILLLSFTAGLLFAVAELIFSIYSHSQSTLMDAVYDSVELIFIALVLFLTPLFHKPVSEKRPYGFFQIESIFLIIKGVMMLAVTFGVIANVVQLALSGGNEVDGLQVSIFQLATGAICAVIYFIMRRMNRHLSSPTIQGELLGWRLDVGYSLGLAVAFFGSTFLERTPLAFLAPYFDPVMAVVVSLFMLPDNIRLLIRAVRSVFLFSPSEESMEEIKSICEPILAEHGMESVFYDVTRTGRHLWISVYFTIKEKSLELRRLRRATDEASEALSARFENCSCELLLNPEDEYCPEIE